MSDHRLDGTSPLMPTTNQNNECIDKILLTKWWSIFAPINLIRRLPTKVQYILLIILTIVINSIIYIPLKNVFEAIFLVNFYREYMIAINFHALLSTATPIIALDIIIWMSIKSNSNFNAYPAGFNVILCNGLYIESNSSTQNEQNRSYNNERLKYIFKNIKCFAKNFLFSWVFVVLLTCYQSYVIPLIEGARHRSLAYLSATISCFLSISNK
jgi:hypothetical protein